MDDTTARPCYECKFKTVLYQTVWRHYPQLQICFLGDFTTRNIGCVVVIPPCDRQTSTLSPAAHNGQRRLKSKMKLSSWRSLISTTKNHPEMCPINEQKSKPIVVRPEISPKINNRIKVVSCRRSSRRVKLRTHRDVNNIDVLDFDL